MVFFFYSPLENRTAQYLGTWLVLSKVFLKLSLFIFVYLALPFFQDADRGEFGVLS